MSQNQNITTERIIEMLKLAIETGLSDGRTPPNTETWIETGDVVAGDTIRFREGVFGGSMRSPRYRGDRIIEAAILRDSYGANKQQHTFTLRILESSGVEPLKPGTETRRKGRNVYRNGTDRQLWANEDAREIAADEKHGRGDTARAAAGGRRQYGK